MKCIWDEMKFIHRMLTAGFGKQSNNRNEYGRLVGEKLVISALNY